MVVNRRAKMVTDRRQRSVPQRSNRPAPHDPRYQQSSPGGADVHGEILCMAGFATYPALLPVLRTDWGLSNAAAGLVGGILFFGYVGSVPILTSLTDRIDARRIYLGSSCSRPAAPRHSRCSPMASSER